jgi:citrate synthase
MSDEIRYPTSIGSSDPDSITLLGHNLATDLLGRIGFSELAFWLITAQRPTAGQAKVFETVLVALADHGLTPTAIATRVTYLSAPDSIQGALAAGLLGGGSRFLGVTTNWPAGPTSNGTRWPSGPSGSSARPAGSCPASAIRCTRTATRAPR